VSNRLINRKLLEQIVADNKKAVMLHA